MKKRIISFILAFIMISTMVPMTAIAENLGETQVKIGAPIGDILYSDIVAFIDGYAIPTSIKTGTTMVVVEDLRYYGFDVVWNGSERTLNVEFNADKPFKPIAVEKDTSKPSGTFKCKYVYTDIRTYISGELIESFAINGVTLINFELLKKYGKLNWNGEAREIKLTLNRPAPPEPEPEPEPEPYIFIDMDEQADWDIFMAQNVYNLGNASTYAKLENNFTWLKFEPVLKSFTQKFGKSVTYKAPAKKEAEITKGEVISYLYEIIKSALKIKNPEKAVDYFAKNGLINVHPKGNYPLGETCSTDEMIVLSVRVYEYLCYELGLDSKGFFWKVTGGKNTVYLLGSRHYTDSSLYPMSEPIYDAFDNSAYLVVERYFSYDTKEDEDYYYKKSVLPNGKKISDYLDPEIYELYWRICEEYGVSRTHYDYIYPWAAAELIDDLYDYILGEMYGDEFHQDSYIAWLWGIDNHFKFKAENQDKKIIQLETSKSRTDMSASYSYELQEVLLAWSMMDVLDLLFDDTHSEKSQKKDEQFYKELAAFKSGDEAAMLKIIGFDIKDDDPSWWIEYMYKLTTARDIMMTEQIIKFLTEGTGDYFVVVGAAHLIKDGSIVDLLIKAGYTVERIK